MGIFAALFGSKPKPSAPAAPVPSSAAKAARPARPFEMERVVATSGVPVPKTNGVPPVPKPVASAAALQMPQPVLPRSITQRLMARPALPAPRSNESFGSVEANGSSGEVMLTLGDVLPQIPVLVIDQNATVDLNRVLFFPMAQLGAEMARGRPAVPLVSVVRQCPELFRNPESIDPSEMVRLPMQKLLEQIGKLKRIDFTNTPRALPLAAPAEPRPQPFVAEKTPNPRSKPETTPLPSWLNLESLEPAKELVPIPAAPRPSAFVEKPAEAVLQPFHPAPTDNASTIVAEIIEIIPTKTEPARSEPEIVQAIPELVAIEPEPLAGTQIEEYDVPTSGEAPVIEVAPPGEAILDVFDSWPIEEEAWPIEKELEAGSRALAEEVPLLPIKDEVMPATSVETVDEKSVEKAATPPPAIPFPPIDLPVRPTIPSLKSALIEPLRLLPPPAVHTKIEPGPMPFVVIGPVLPERSTPAVSPFESEYLSEFKHPSTPKLVETAPKAEEPPVPSVPDVVAPSVAAEAETDSALIKPAATAAPVATVATATPIANTAPIAPRPPVFARVSAPADFAPPKGARVPVIPKFPFRAPRSISKSSRPAESNIRPRPTPPRSPLFRVLPVKDDQAAPKKPEVKTPQLFGANPLDRYFSTKAIPPVNWYAAGALLSVAGEVTPTRIVDAIVGLPAITACMLAAPPTLAVSGAWPANMGVDNSLAFGRRLGGVLKQRDPSVVAHRQIATDVGNVLVFAVDDLLLCAVSQDGAVAPAIRQRLLVVAKAMAHARQAARKTEDLEL